VAPGAAARVLDVSSDAPDAPRSARARIVVLLSGTGTLCAALLDAAAGPDAGFEVVAVGTDRADAAGLAHAHRRGVPTFVVALRDHPDRAAWDAALAAELTARRPDWVVCAGFMKLLGPAVLGAFPDRVVNTHPALLPAFPGAHAVRDALAAGVGTTGATVHLVDAGLDTGPVLAQRPVPVLPDDDEDRLHERIKTVERELLVQTLAGLVAAGLPTTIAPTSGDPR
jgi:phosphoribosylglycinamide formyltransferase 1